LREFAEAPAHHWDPIENPRFSAEEDARYVAELTVEPATTMRFVYVIIRWQDRLLRKLSVSAKAGSTTVSPNPSLMLACLQDYLGFEPAKWRVVDDEDQSIVVLQRFNP
jgi:hypothetical protein